MDWGGFRFQDPAWLWAALLGPLVLLAAWLRERDPLTRGRSRFPGRRACGVSRRACG